MPIMSAIARAFTASLLVIVVGGCAAETSASDAASNSISSSEALRLYKEPAAPFGRCDLGTDLTISPISDARLERGGAVGEVSLRESVPSGCEAVRPDPRSYELIYGGDECGSAVYVASMTVDGRSRSFKLTDHRRRACRDLVPAPVVVEEETATGDIGLLYARDPSEVSCKIISGKWFAAGTTFRDRCNACSCSKDGELTCTMMGCSEARPL